jgi:hypothetical protein
VRSKSASSAARRRSNASSKRDWRALRRKQLARSSRGKYVETKPEELEAVEIVSTHTIDIYTFVPEEEVGVPTIRAHAYGQPGCS